MPAVAEAPKTPVASTEKNLRWSLKTYFPEFDGPEYREFRDRLSREVVQLREDAAALGPITDANIEKWVDLLLRDEAQGMDLSHIGSYIGCLTSCDAKNEAYKKEEARLALLDAEATKAGVQIQAVFRDVSDALFEKLVSHEKLASARYAFERLRKDAKMTMATDLEMLTADLDVDGMGAWGRLYDTIAGGLEFDMTEPDGTVKRVPMSQRRGLLENPDRRIRKAAFEGSNKAWEGVEESVGAALNHISGTRLTLYKRRGIKHFLDVALFQSRIEKATLDAMLGAVARLRHIPHRFLRLKAKLMGQQKLAYYDLPAPLPFKAKLDCSWEEGKRLVSASGHAFYRAFGEFVDMTYAQDWIESEKRPGKRPGAFCTSSYKTRESRVYMTFNGTFGDAGTLAHELGHAFHNWVMRDLRPFQRGYPMTLAETASTFAEGILNKSILEDPATPEARKAQLLASELSDATIFLCDIPMRFGFEKAVYEERADGELPISRFKEIMIEQQRESFGDTLEEAGMDNMFWASKLHFYITGVSFYNFPYTFGDLLSRGLMARARKEGPSFLPKYEAFLRMTGSAGAEDVAMKALGIDLRKPDFWEESIKSLEPSIDLLEKVAPAAMA